MDLAMLHCSKSASRSNEWFKPIFKAYLSLACGAQECIWHTLNSNGHLQQIKTEQTGPYLWSRPRRWTWGTSGCGSVRWPGSSWWCRNRSRACSGRLHWTDRQGSYLATSTESLTKLQDRGTERNRGVETQCGGVVRPVDVDTHGSPLELRQHIHNIHYTTSTLLSLSLSSLSLALIPIADTVTIIVDSLSLPFKCL